MATFIKAGFWEKLCQKCTGYKGWLNLDQFVESKIPTPTYKVFSALLTQSGGDNTQYINWDDNPNTLTIGVTYTITANDDNTNFVIAGAPNNNVGTSFIATSQTVGWDTHSQGNNQVSYNTGAPIVNVLENTIGNIYWTYVIDGVYTANLLGAFDPEKTFVTISNPNSAYVESPGVCDTNVSIDAVQINTFDSGFFSTNGQLYLNSFEIRVYN